MNKLRTLIAALATTATLGAATLTPASAYVHPGHGGFGHGGFGQFHSHFRINEHWRFSFRFNESWRVGGVHCWRCGPHWGWRYHYRFAYGAPVVAAPSVAACPAGFHLGYLGKHCWPNR